MTATTAPAGAPAPGAPAAPHRISVARGYRFELVKLLSQWRVRLLILACWIGPGLLVVAVSQQASLPADTLFGRWMHATGWAGALVVLGFGALSAWGAVLAGLTDHKDVDPGDARNMATLHGLTNIVATIGYTIAFFVRLAGGVGAARWISLVAFVLLASGAFIGGHLVYKYGIMVNRNAFSGGRRAKEFTPILPAAELPEETPTKAALGPTNLVLVRRGDVVFALKATCTHAGGPLAEGTLKGNTITCPWHGSVFRLSDGAVRHGPAQTREIAYRARISEGQVEVQGPIG